MCTARSDKCRASVCIFISTASFENDLWPDASSLVVWTHIILIKAVAVEKTYRATYIHDN